MSVVNILLTLLKKVTFVTWTKPYPLLDDIVQGAYLFYFTGADDDVTWIENREWQLADEPKLEHKKASTVCILVNW